jgi:hypothetical protein
LLNGKGRTASHWGVTASARQGRTVSEMFSFGGVGVSR